MRDQRFIAVHRGGPLSLEQHQQLAEWAAKCADHVLHLFAAESADDRPAAAIKVTRNWIREECSVGDARNAAFSAHEAARGVTTDAATFSARASGHAVATAHMADHSIRAAAYAIKAVAAASGKSDTDVTSEYLWQQQQLPDEIRDLVKSSFLDQYSGLVADSTKAG